MATQTLNQKIVIIIYPAEIPPSTQEKIVIQINPQPTPSQTKTLTYPFNITAGPINVNITEPLILAALDFINEAFNLYIDEDRELKTLLNYGEDRQTVIINKRYGTNQDSVQLKLLTPLPENVDPDTPVFISREVAKTLIDKVRIRFAPELDVTPYLRPKNLSAPIDTTLGKELRNVTLRRLQLNSGSVGIEDQYNNISFEDSIFRRWYSYDFNSSELNIDFTDYNNFIFYSSAFLRLQTFKEKLKSIEELDIKRIEFINSIFTGSSNFAGSTYVQEKTANLASQKEDIIRGFDRYEQYLYFTTSGSNSPYSASFDYVDGGTEYNSIGYWPKSGSALWPTYSDIAVNWFNSQSAIAQRFDEFNENNLINTIPTHVREDDDSAAYITFVSMIGHFLDTIKPYIDQYPNIYSRYLDPNEELSKDLVADVAEAIGFRMPTVNSLYNLSDNILGTGLYAPRRDYTVETHKRLLHNLPFFAKAKGTRTAIDVLLRSLGISSEFLTVKESGTPTTSSYYIHDEYTNGLKFEDDTTAFVKIPVSASNRDPFPKLLQFGLFTTKNKTSTILNGDNLWALNIVIHPTASYLGRFELVSGSSQNVILSSSYQEIYGDDVTNVVLYTETGSTALRVVSTLYDSLVFDSQTIESSSNFGNLWNSTQYIYMGGSGSMVTSRFDGVVDNISLWGKVLSDEAVLTNVYDPASTVGDEYTDPVNYLYIHLSFDSP